jgi:hypothetical protein
MLPPYCLSHWPISRNLSVVDDQPRLERSHHLEQRHRVPVLGLSAQVEPEAVDSPVIGQKLADLAVQVLDVAGVVLGAVVGVVPVGLGVVNDELQAGLVAGVGHLLHHVDLPGRLGPGDPVVGQLRVVEAEPVVVLDQEDHVLHAGVLGDLDPLAGVELVGLPLFVEVVVDLDGCGPLALPHAELAAARRAP